MKTLILLIVLTQNGAGDINASFVNAETLEQCQQKALMLEDVFKTSNIPVIESRCIQSHHQFSEFSHASAASMIRYFYLIEFNDETVEIKTVENWSQCKQQERDDVSNGKRYCASSVQSLS